MTKEFSKLQLWWWHGKLPRWLKWKFCWYIKKNRVVIFVIVFTSIAFLVKLYQVYKYYGHL